MARLRDVDFQIAGGIEVIRGEPVGIGIAPELVSSEIDVLGGSEFSDVVLVIFKAAASTQFSALFFGAETALEALKRTEVAFEIGDGASVAESFEDAGLDKEKRGLEPGAEMGLAFDADGIGELAGELNRTGVRMTMRVEAREGAAAGGEVQAALGSRTGEKLNGNVVGVLGAGAEYAILIFRAEALEFINLFHVSA
jgi:hypothetical protein